MTDFHDFKGAAVQMDDYDLPRIGHIIGVGEDPLHAILDVESRGEGFRKDGRPVLLREEHYFFRLLKDKPVLQKRAVDHGLAWPVWRRNYPADSYTWLRDAVKIDESAAIMSCSWGLGQIMGANFGMCGYKSPQDFVFSMMADEANHLEAMVRFIIASGIDDEMRALDAAKTRERALAIARVIARIYNGPQYEKNRYHERIVDRLWWWRGKPDTPWSPDIAKKEQADADMVNEIKDSVDATVTNAEPGPVPAPKPEKLTIWQRLWRYLF